LFALAILTQRAHPSEQVLDPACRAALKSSLVDHFAGNMTGHELRLNTDAQLDLILAHFTMRSLQIDSDKEKELLISIPFRAERAGGHVVVMDHDRKDGWKCLGILWGSHASAGREMHHGYFDLSTAQNTGGGEYVTHTHRFENERYKRAPSQKSDQEGD